MHVICIVKGLKAWAQVPVITTIIPYRSLAAGTKLTVVGYGEYKNYAIGQYSDVPRKGEITTISFAECKKSLCGGRDCNVDVKNVVICSSNKEGLSGPCAGDAGAPAFFIREDGAHVLAGIAAGTVGGAFGICNNGTFLFADLAPFVGWIHRRISHCGNYAKNKGLDFDQPSVVPCPR